MGMRKRVRGTFEKVVPISPEFYDDHKDEDLIAPKSVLLPFNAVLMLTQWIAFAALMVYYSGPAAEVQDVRVEAQWDYGAPDYNCTPLAKDSYWGQRFNFDTCVELSQPPSSGIDSSSSTEFYRYTQFPFLNRSAPFHAESFGVGEYGDEQGAQRAFAQFTNRLEGLDLTCPYSPPEIPGGTLEIPKFTYKWVDYPGDFSAVPEYKGTRADVCTDYADDAMDGVKRRCKSDSCARPERTSDELQICAQARFEAYAKSKIEGGGNEDKNCIHLPGADLSCTTGGGCVYFSPCVQQCVNLTYRSAYDNRCTWNDFTTADSAWGNDPFEPWDDLQSRIDARQCDLGPEFSVLDMLEPSSCYYHFDNETVDALFQLNPKLKDLPFDYRNIDIFEGNPLREAEYFNIIQNYNRGKVLRRCEVPESDAITILNVFHDEKITCQYAKENFPFTCVASFSPSIAQRGSMSYANSLLLYSVFSAICVKVFFASSSKGDKAAPDDIAKDAEVAAEETEASASGKRTRSNRAKGLLEKVVPISPEFYDRHKDEDLIAPKSVLLPFNAVLMLTQWIAFAALMVYYSGTAAEVTEVELTSQWDYGAPDYNCTPMTKDSYWGHRFNFDTCMELSQPPSSGIYSSSDAYFYKQYAWHDRLAPFHAETFGVGEYGGEQGAQRALEEFTNRLEGLDLTCPYFAPAIPGETLEISKSTFTWVDMENSRDWEHWEQVGAPCLSNLTDIAEMLNPNSCHYHFDMDTIGYLLEMNPRVDDQPYDSSNAIIPQSSIDSGSFSAAQVGMYHGIVGSYARGKVLRRCEVPESDALTILNKFHDEKQICMYAKENFPFTCTKKAPPSIPQRGSLSYGNSLLLYSVFSAICVKVFFASSSKGDKAAPDDIAKDAEVAAEETEASASGKRTRSNRAKGLLEKVVPISPEFYDEDKDEDLIAPKSVLLPFNAVLMLTQWIAFAALMVYYSGPAAEVTDVQVEAQWNFSAPDYNCTPMYFDSYWGQEFNFDTCVELSQPPSSGIDSSSSTEFYRYTQFPFLNVSAPFHEDTFGVGEYGDDQGAQRAFAEFTNRLEGLDLTCPYFAPATTGGTLEIPKSTYKWVDYAGDFSAVPFHYKLSRADVCTTFSPNDRHDAQRHWCFGYSCGRPDAATNTSQNCGQASFENYADAITTGNMPDTKLCLHPSSYTGNQACGTGGNSNNHADCTGIDATVRANLDVGCDWTDFYSSFYQTWDPLESLWKTCDSNSSSVAELFDEDSCYYKFDQVTVDLLVELNPRLAETPFSESHVTTFTGEPSMKAAYFGTVGSYARGKVLRRCAVPESDALTILNVFHEEKITCQYAKENYPFSCTKKGPPSIPQRASLAYANSLLLYTVFSAICVRVFFASSSKVDKDTDKRADGEVPA